MTLRRINSDQVQQTLSLVNPGETLVVNADSQMLFATPIVVDAGGVLTVIGDLVDVTPLSLAGGADKDVQFNNGGLLDGSPMFTRTQLSAVSQVLSLNGVTITTIDKTDPASGITITPEQTVSYPSEYPGQLLLQSANYAGSGPTSGATLTMTPGDFAGNAGSLQLNGGFSNLSGSHYGGYINVNGGGSSSPSGSVLISAGSTGSDTTSGNVTLTTAGSSGHSFTLTPYGELMIIADPGTAGYVLTSGGAAAPAAWAPASGGSGTPAGPSTSIQWNNSGAFAGNAEFEFDNTGGTWNSIVLGDAGGAVLKVWNQATNNGVELTGRAADASIGNNPDPVYVIGGQETSTSNQGASLAANAGSLTSGGGFNLSGGSVASVTTGDGSSGGGVQFASGQGDVSGPVSFFVNPGHSQGGGIDFSAGVATNSDSMPEIGGTLTLNAGHASHAGNIDGDITLKTGDASVVPASGGLISFTTKGGSHTPLQFNRDGEWQVGDSHDSGTVNQVLISQGTGSSPIWAAPAPTYTLATLPTAVAGFMITVTDANGGAGALCYSLGATWLDAGTHATVV